VHAVLLVADNTATRFLGAYDHASRSLAYVNCGQNPDLAARGRQPRAPGTAPLLRRLAPSQWQAAVSRIRLDTGDLLVGCSDGVTEANRGKEEFGEPRSIAEFGSGSV
jgi:serine phosphatase RsbU (regulator of sigma subunit)